MPKDPNKEHLARYEKARVEVKRAVDDADPVGLLAMGAPGDEYDDIVGHLLSKVMRNDEITVTSLASWIRDRYGVEPSVSALVEQIAPIQARVHQKGGSSLTTTSRRPAASII